QGHHDRGARRAPRPGAHRRASLHARPARPGPAHPDLGRAAPLRLPALAERAFGVLLLRGLLACLPPSGLPPRAPRLRRAQPALRLLSATPSRPSPATALSGGPSGLAPPVPRLSRHGGSTA